MLYLQVSTLVMHQSDAIQIFPWVFYRVTEMSVTEMNPD